MNAIRAIICCLIFSTFLVRILIHKILNVGARPISKNILISASPSLSCVPPEKSLIDTSFRATKKYVKKLINRCLIFFVPKQTSEAVIVKTIGVSNMPFGAK
jgi:hypothetical protein